MFISEIEFVDFKNLHGIYKLSKGLNLLVRENGWGKTNFLESIDYLSQLKSFRGITDAELLNWEGKHAFAKLDVHLGGKEKKTLQVVISINESNDKSKKVLINNISTSFSKFKSHFETLLYSPHNADIVSSSPQIRRDQFDRIISQIDEKYSKLLREYKFVVKSKNRILQKLKGGIGSISELDYWNEKLINIGQEIIEKRVVFLHEIQPFVETRAKSTINGKDSLLEIEYHSKVFDGDEIILREKVFGNVDKEIVVGLSLYGPHKDSFVFNLNGKPLRDYGSRGQQRLAGLILILCLYEHFKEKRERYPLLLLDDVMSELDEEHRKKVEKLILGTVKSQAIITSSVKEHFSAGFVKKAINVKDSD